MPRQLFGKLLLLVAGACIGFVICEVVLRLRGPSSAGFHVTDPIVGMALAPHAEGWWTSEGRAYVRINSQGLRDREHAKGKPANTLRIAVLGDSMAEAVQVPMEQTFWSVGERTLQRCPALGGQQVEVINFGVSGYGTAQELLTLRHKVWEYAPDIVLLAVTTRNDVGDGSRAIRQSNEVPYFVLADGRLVLDDSFLRGQPYRLKQSTLYSLYWWLRAHSRTVDALNDAAVRVYLSSRRASNPNTSAALAGYREPRDPIWQEAWAVTEALIGQMRDEVNARHARFFVVTLSGPVQVDPDPQVRLEAMKEHGIDDFFYPEQRIKAFCEREHIPVLVLAPGMQRYAEQNHVHLHGFGPTLGDGHWNELGHRLSGERIGDWLCERLAS